MRRVFVHELGRDSTYDELVFGTDLAATDHPNVSVSEAGRWLVVHVHKSWGESQAYLADAWAEPLRFSRLTPDRRHSYEVTAHDTTLYVLSNEDAPRFALYAVDPERAEREAWQLVVPEHETDVLSSITICQGQIFANYLHDAASRLQRFALDGTNLGDLALPDIGTSD